jgi:hypothetical protein
VGRCGDSQDWGHHGGRDEQSGAKIEEAADRSTASSDRTEETSAAAAEAELGACLALRSLPSSASSDGQPRLLRPPLEGRVEIWSLALLAPALSDDVIRQSLGGAFTRRRLARESSAKLDWSAVEVVDAASAEEARQIALRGAENTGAGVDRVDDASECAPARGSKYFKEPLATHGMLVSDTARGICRACAACAACAANPRPESSSAAQGCRAARRLHTRVSSRADTAHSTSATSSRYGSLSPRAAATILFLGMLGRCVWDPQLLYSSNSEEKRARL